MSTTVAQVISKCRAELHDEAALDADRTWQDADFYRPVYEAEQAIKRLLPEAFYNAVGTKLTSPALSTATTDTLAVSDDYFSHLCEHVMGALYLHDASGRHDPAKSAEHVAKFTAMMNGDL